MAWYTSFTSPLGWVLLAANPNGIVSLFLGDPIDTLLDVLSQTLPNNLPSTPDTPVHGGLMRAAALLETSWSNGFQPIDPWPDDELPLAPSGSAFQQSVWQALRQTKPGERYTYAQLAQQLGRPSAIRAVASACARNPVSLIIPCHRIIRRDGQLGGYRWGLSRKQWLLEQEATWLSATETPAECHKTAAYGFNAIDSHPMDRQMSR